MAMIGCRHGKLKGDGPQCFLKCLDEIAAQRAAAEPESHLDRITKQLASPRSLPVSKGVSKAVSKGKTGALTNAEHQARWRKAHPERHREQQRAHRARKAAA
jgi:hypothetical protein